MSYDGSQKSAGAEVIYNLDKDAAIASTLSLFMWPLPVVSPGVDWPSGKQDLLHGDSVFPKVRIPRERK